MNRTFFDQCPVAVIGWGPGWLAAEKPSGMSVHNDPGTDLCTVVNQWLQSNQTADESVAYDRRYGVHPVHRLDRETSGIILLSFQRNVFDFLSRQFAQARVTKKYVALAHGSVTHSKSWGHWRWPLTPKSAGRRTPQGQGRRLPCQTQFRTIKCSAHYSLIECRLLTGRTHQIRRHAALAGHPLVGDRRYGSLRACRYLEQHHDFHGLALHAAGLKFIAPETNQLRSVAAPMLPTKIRQLFDDDCAKTPTSK